MKPFQKLAESTTPQGDPLELFEHDGHFYISSRGQHILTSMEHGSAEELARIACQSLRLARKPKVLIGGYGMGYTLAAACETLPQIGAEFLVAESSQAILDWNRSHLRSLHPDISEDQRISVQNKPLQEFLFDSASYSAILLDRDNDDTDSASAALYTIDGMHQVKAALKSGGILAIASSQDDPKFTKLLRKVGFQTHVEKVPAAHKGRKNRLHTIWLAINGHYQSQNKRR